MVFYLINKLVGKEPSEEESRNFTNLISKVFGKSIRQRPKQAQLTKIKQSEDSKDALAFLVEGPEPIDWNRTQLDVLWAKRAAPRPNVPANVKLTDVTFGKAMPNEESVSLLLRDATDLTGHRIEYWKMPGPIAEFTGFTMFKDEFDKVASGLLFLEAFGPNALDQYAIVDEGAELGPAHWLSERSPSGNHIIQTAPVFSGSVTGDVREQAGTSAVTGSSDWANVRIRAKLRSESTGALGLVFRFQNKENWNRFSMDDNGRTLIRCVKGKRKILWQDDVPCERSKSYSIVIEVVQ